MSRDRERQAIAQVACPTCHASAGQPCRDPGTRRPILTRGRPYCHTERRQAWQASRPADAVEQADIVMSDQHEGVPGRRHRYVVLAPLTDRGRGALPDGPTRVELHEMRATLAFLRGLGLIVMRED